MFSHQNLELEKEIYFSSLTCPAEGMEKLNHEILSILQELKTVLTLLDRE